MSSQRLFQIMHLLLDKQSITANELAQRFEVSVRTIYRDIEALSAAGIPVYATQGKGGGIGLLDSYILNRSYLSPQEQDYILSALNTLGAQQPDVEALKQKLSALFKKEHKNWIEVDFSRWGNNDGDQEKFEILRKAIQSKRIIQFLYTSAYGEKTQRSVKPVKLIFKSKSWYLQGFCLERNAFRTFKINRMNFILPTMQTFTEEYTPPPLDNYEPIFPLTPLTLKFHKLVAHRVFEEFDEKAINYDQDGHLIIHVTMPDDPWIYAFFLSFGASCQILHPPHMAEKLLTEAKKILELYS